MVKRLLYLSLLLNIILSYGALFILINDCRSNAVIYKFMKSKLTGWRIFSIWCRRAGIQFFHWQRAKCKLPDIFGKWQLHVIQTLQQRIFKRMIMGFWVVAGRSNLVTLSIHRRWNIWCAKYFWAKRWGYYADHYRTNHLINELFSHAAKMNTNIKYHLHRPAILNKYNIQYTSEHSNTSAIVTCQ